jgi:hypothetical protein
MRQSTNWVEIPPITDPQGRGWQQPAKEELLIEGTISLMTTKTFNKLAEYSYSLPTGVYQGKMWKRQVDILQKDEIGNRIRIPGPWFLCWYEDNPLDSDKCMVKIARILLIDQP